MAEPNLPIEVPFTNHGQEDGPDYEPNREGKMGVSGTHRGTGRKNVSETYTGNRPRVAGGRFNEGLVE